MNSLPNNDKNFIQPIHKYLKRAPGAHLHPWHISPCSPALPARAMHLRSAVTMLLIKLSLFPLFLYTLLAY